MANIKLMLETYNEIKEHPESHYQRDWRCTSGMCFAGHAAVLGGDVEFFTKPNQHFAGYVLEPEKYGLLPEAWGEPGTDNVTYWRGDEEQEEVYTVPLIHVADLAQELLGIDDDERSDLFRDDNTLEDIRGRIMQITGVDPEDPGNIEGLVQGEY